VLLKTGEMSFAPLSRLASEISLSSQLGAGQFGKVYKGTIQFDDARQITVAAKTLKCNYIWLT